MADIFIAYGHEDKNLVTHLAKALEVKGWSVFWDEQIGPEAFGRVIEREIKQAAVMIVVWSNASVDAEWPKSEVDMARNLGRQIFHLRISDAQLPLPFNIQNALDFTGWRGDQNSLAFRKLDHALKKSITRPVGNGQIINWPCFFRSVSSHECFLEPLDAVAAFKIADPMPILLSAFDLWHNKDAEALYKEMKTLHGDSYLVMLDSGDYESKRKGVDLSWDDYKDTLVKASGTFDIAVCYDVHSRSTRSETIIKEIVEGFQRDAEIAPAEKLAPVVHLPEGKASPIERVPEIFFALANSLKPPLIAIPERELGDGILARARQISRIRSELDKLDRYQPIHVLGTGNPLSIAIFALAGADSFDGLEWCRTAVDFQTARLHHTQQYDFFSYQSQSAEDKGIRDALSNNNFSFLDKVALHNLAFFEEWMDRIADNERQSGWLKSYLPPGGYDDLRRELPEVFL
ncbi:TIR domain-containing protein [Desulfovibrio aminophilus]|uniref:toll/interleukin-1 receptor domain-containing protein n=1 Tax=Desulfovibrio aminophilus TaxID=81425 RepID=UPI0033972D95